MIQSQSIKKEASASFFIDFCLFNNTYADNERSSVRRSSRIQS